MGSGDLNNSSAAKFSPFKAQNYSNQHLSPPDIGLSPHTRLEWAKLRIFADLKARVDIPSRSSVCYCSPRERWKGFSKHLQLVGRLFGVQRLETPITPSQHPVLAKVRVRGGEGLAAVVVSPGNLCPRWL